MIATFTTAPKLWYNGSRPGPGFCLLFGVSSDYAQRITAQVTEVTCPVIGRAQAELTHRAKHRKPAHILARRRILKNHAQHHRGRIFTIFAWELHIACIITCYLRHATRLSYWNNFCHSMWSIVSTCGVLSKWRNGVWYIFRHNCVWT